MFDLIRWLILFVCVGLHLKSFQLIKIYINLRNNPIRNRSPPPIPNNRTAPELDEIHPTLSLHLILTLVYLQLKFLTYIQFQVLISNIKTKMLRLSIMHR